MLTKEEVFSSGLPKAMFAALIIAAHVITPLLQGKVRCCFFPPEEQDLGETY